MQLGSSYPKILHVGDKQIADLFDDEVQIEEKLDGSMFGFGKVNNELIVRSKGKQIDLNNIDKMFLLGVEYIKSIEKLLPNNVFFYGEYLEKPRHSTLAYSRIPKNHIMLFGVQYEDKTMGEWGTVNHYAEKFNIDTVPLLYKGRSSPEHMLSFFKENKPTKSYLGGQNIEGVVVKRYEDWLFLGRILTPVKAGKYVSEKFKEVHEKDWSKLNTSKGKFDSIKDKYRSEARWNKAIMHLKERGEFEGSVRDIGKLIQEIQKDLEIEEISNIKDDLYKVYSKDILHHSTYGFVDWFKQEIARGKFND